MEDTGKDAKKGARKKGAKTGRSVVTSTDPGFEREKALQTTLASIEKQFGKGAVIKMGESGKNKNIPVVTTGVLSVDVALGIGGIPKGRIIEIYGPEASGKTTIALHMVSEVQKAGGIASYIDAEHALDPVYARKLGVDIDELYISQPDDGEQALEICEAMVRSAAIDIIVVDSVAALVPKAEIDGEMGASHMGIQARLMSQALRKLTGVTSKTNTIVIFINQLRDKIGITFGNAETTTGGRALKFYASIRIDIRKAESIKVGENLVGSRTKIKIAKNKLAPPFKTCKVDIMFGRGISKEGDLLDLGSDVGIVDKSGSWYSYKETRLGQGRENAKLYIMDHVDIYKQIENEVRAHYGISTLEEAAAVAATAVPQPIEGLTDLDVELKTDDLNDLQLEDQDEPDYVNIEDDFDNYEEDEA